MNSRLLFSLLVCFGSIGHAEVTSETNERLRDGLKQYPAADVNQDGILTMTEAKDFLAKKKQKTTETKKGSLKPDVENVSYGNHERNQLDLYLAKDTSAATPLVVLIHGGGFRNGDKSRWASEKATEELLKNGISCAAINYPFLEDQPIQDILHHCARAVQFLRAHSSEWNLDKTRFAAMGGSAGAGTSLWLATRDDLADPKSEDPVLRESSRLVCAACNSTQATYDVSRWESFMGPAKPEFGTSEAEAALFYHLPSKAAFLTEPGKAILKECDMLSWISKDDPPLFINNGQVVDAPSNRGEWLHCIHHAREVYKVCASAAVPCIVLQDQTEPKTDATDFLIQHLAAAGE